MKKLVILSFFAFITVLSVNAQPYPYMDVSGYASIKVTPDIINVSVSFGENKEFFGKQNIEDLEQKVIKVLKENGLDIKKDVSVQESSSQGEGGRVYIRKTISFTLDNYKKYYDIVRELDFKGIQSVRINSTKYSKEDEVKLALLPEAMKNARAMAEAILKDSEAEVGKLLYVNAQKVRMSYAQNKAVIVGYGTRKDAKEYVDKPVDITLSVDMSVCFSISYPKSE
jgi:uncharacterized protein YggE